MSKPETIKIDEVEYIRKDKQSIAPPVSDVKIVVADRGFVYIGRVQIEPNFVVVKEARNIRVWGTTKGLGQLVNGVTKDTKLDDVGTVNIPLRAVISVIDVNQKAWSIF